MAKTAAQRLARARRRKAKAARNRSGAPHKGAQGGKGKRGPVFVNPQPVKKKKNSNNGLNGSRSMVTDGVNVGSVWKNTTAERITFPMAREKVSDLTSAGTAFQMLEQLYVNPGNSELFPVFSQIAACYEEYIPTHLKFIFRTEEYMASGSTVSAGVVGLAANFDPNDGNFPNMTALENYEHSISGPPFSGIIVADVLAAHRKRFKGKSRDLALNNYYVYNSVNSIGPSTDQAKFYDLASFQLACNGCQAGIIGELWVEYSFTMIRRKSPENGAFGFTMAHIKGYGDNATAASPLGLTPFTSATLGTGSTLSLINMTTALSTYGSTTIGLSDTVDTALNLPNATATWLVTAVWNGAAGIAGTPTLTVTGPAASSAIYGPLGASDGNLYGHFLAAGTSASCSIVVNTVLTGIPVSTTNLITVGGLASMTSGNYDIFICRIPSGMTAKSPLVIEDELSELRDQVAEMRAFMSRFSASSSSSSLLISQNSDSEDDCKVTDDVKLPDIEDLEKSVHIPRSLARKLFGK